MTECSRVMRCDTEDVYAVLSDGWTFGLWVVGAARVREVDDGWPAEGTRIHHSVGAWPLLLHDTTTSAGADPAGRLRLRARAWPTGEAVVDIRAEPHPDGCVVTMDEKAVSGPATLVPSLVERPLLRLRNTETLRRLAYLAEGRARS